MNYTFTKEVTLDGELIEDVIESAGYSIGYWATTARHDRLEETYTISWDGNDFDRTQKAHVGKGELTYEDIAKAIEQLSKGETKVGDWLLTQLSDWLNGQPTMDNDLADVIIQVALFGEIIYG